MRVGTGIELLTRGERKLKLLRGSLGGKDLGTVLMAERKQNPTQLNKRKLEARWPVVHRDSLVSILDLTQNHTAL